MAEGDFSIKATISANTSQFIDGIKKGEQSLTSFSGMIDKILGLRVFCDDRGLTNLSLYDVKGQIMSVSQFTLYADTSGGRRPSFVNAMKPDQARELYAYFNQQLESKFGPIATGIFGADMKVSSVNDGPFTVLLDSEELFK